MVKEVLVLKKEGDGLIFLELAASDKPAGADKVEETELNVVASEAGLHLDGENLVDITMLNSCMIFLTVATQVHNLLRLSVNHC